MDFFIDFITDNFQNCIWLAVLIIAICPTLESKIAIPLAMNTVFWGSEAYSPLIALLLAFIGSILPSIFIMMITRRIKQKTTGFITSRFIQRYQVKSSKIDYQTSNFKKYLLLTCFVAVPIPLTGVWAGSIIAGLSNLNIKYSFISIAIGALISAGAITLICTLWTNSISSIFIISILIVIIFLFVELFLSLIKRKT